MGSSLGVLSAVLCTIAALLFAIGVYPKMIREARERDDVIGTRRLLLLVGTAFLITVSSAAILLTVCPLSEVCRNHGYVVADLVLSASVGMFASSIGWALIYRSND